MFNLRGGGSESPPYRYYPYAPFSHRFAAAGSSSRGYQLDGVDRAGWPADAAALALSRVDVDLREARRVEYRAELALGHTRLAAVAQVPVDPADVFAPKEARRAVLPKSHRWGFF